MSDFYDSIDDLQNITCVYCGEDFKAPVSADQNDPHVYGYCSKYCYNMDTLERDEASEALQHSLYGLD